MPAMTGLLRRGGQSSDADIRRHSFYAAHSSSTPALPEKDSRASEQIPRRPSAAEFLSRSTAAPRAPAITRTSADNTTLLEEHAGSPVKEETAKPHRFSIIRSRHASDSHLSAKARLHALSRPPIPNCVYCRYQNLSELMLTIDPQLQRL
jgi:hypothetical protein